MRTHPVKAAMLPQPVDGIQHRTHIPRHCHWPTRQEAALSDSRTRHEPRAAQRTGQTNTCQEITTAQQGGRIVLHVRVCHSWWLPPAHTHTWMSTTTNALLTPALRQTQCDTASRANRKERAHPAVVVILLFDVIADGAGFMLFSWRFSSCEVAATMTMTCASISG